jgi:SprT protein
MNDLSDLSSCRKLIRRWTRRWGVPHLAEQITCQWSTRLCRSLGRAYPQRRLIRLSVLLQETPYRSAFEEVLCHEAAHIAAYELHGYLGVNHGPAWKELMCRAGHEPRQYGESVLSAEQHEPGSVRYVHRCPICQATRIAKRPQPQWYCLACRNAGLEGRLIIQSRVMS